VQAYGQDIYGVVNHIQTWELAYQQAQFKFNQLKYWKFSLEEVPTKINIFT
jgi:hypothetical protein